MVFVLIRTKVMVFLNMEINFAAVPPIPGEIHQAFASKNLKGQVSFSQFLKTASGIISVFHRYVTCFVSLLLNTVFTEYSFLLLSPK